MFKKKKFNCNITNADSTSAERANDDSQPTQTAAEQTAAEIEASPDPRSLLKSVISKVVRAAGSEGGLVALYEGEQPFYTASVGIAEGEARSLAASLRSLPELQSHGVSAGEQQTIGLTLSPAEAVSGTAHLQGHDLQLVAIPLRQGDKMVGLLCLLEPGLGDNSDILSRPELYKVITDQIDIVAQNASLFQRLLNEKRWLEEVIQQTSEAILVVDRQRRILGLNHAFERLVGWHGPHVWSKDAEDLLDFRATDNAPQLNDTSSSRMSKSGTGQLVVSHAKIGDGWLGLRLAEAEAEQATSQHSHPAAPEELTILGSDGKRIAVEASIGLIRGNDGAMLGATVTLHDIRARKEAEMMQATFLSVVSHELQTPISVIKGYAGLLRDSLGEDNPKASQQLNIVYGESERLSKMVEDLLTVTRLQAGKLDIHHEPLDPYGLLNRVATRLQVLVSGHAGRSLTVAPYPPKGDEMAGEERLPTIVGDEGRIEQVLTNLVENALKYGEGQITLAAERQGPNVLFSVADEGEGVPSDERDRIFTPFTRLEGRMVRSAKGVGLGLYIAREIITALGGDIWVEEAAGGGAKFAFTVPIMNSEVGD